MVAAVVVAALLLALLLNAGGDKTRAQNRSWDVEGPLLAWDSEIWIVGAIPIVVPDDVPRNGQLILGSTVTASGSYDESGRRIAEHVSLEFGPYPESTLPEIAVTGTIDRIDSHLWIVAGQDVVVANGTQIVSATSGVDPQSLIQIGNHAIVAGYLMDDERIVARQVQLQVPAGVNQPDREEGSDTGEQQPDRLHPIEQPQGQEQPQPVPPEMRNDGHSDDRDEGRSDDDEDDRDDDDGRGGRQGRDMRYDPAKPDRPDEPDRDNHGRDNGRKNDGR